MEARKGMQKAEGRRQIEIDLISWQSREQRNKCGDGNIRTSGAAVL